MVNRIDLFRKHSREMSATEYMIAEKANQQQVPDHESQQSQKAKHFKFILQNEMTKSDKFELNSKK